MNNQQKKKKSMKSHALNETAITKNSWTRKIQLESSNNETGNPISFPKFDYPCINRYATFYLDSCDWDLRLKLREEPRRASSPPPRFSIESPPTAIFRELPELLWDRSSNWKWNWKEKCTMMSFWLFQEIFKCLLEIRLHLRKWHLDPVPR